MRGNNGLATGTRWQDLLLPASIVALGLGFGLVPLMRGQIFFNNDNTVEYYPHTKFLVEALRHGTIPQWWAEVGSGIPVIVEGEAHYSPLRLILAGTLNAPAAFMAEISLWFALAGLGTYLFLRRIDLHPMASLAGSLGFMFGSQFVVYERSAGLLRAACFLPWVMWLAETSFDRRKLALVIGLAPLAIGMQYLAGNPTFAVVTLVSLFCYVFLRCTLLVAAKGKAAIADSIRILGLWVLLTALGVGIGAVQVIPTLRHLNESVGAGGLTLSYVASTSHSSLKDLPHSFFPYLYALRTPQTAITGFYDGALLAAAVLFCLSRIRRTGVAAWCLAVSGVLGVLLSLGASTPLYGLLFRLPVFGSMRFPVRYQFWASFCFACLGAIGVHLAIQANGKRFSWRSFLAPAIILLLLTAMMWRLRPDRSAAVVLCGALLFVSLGLLAAASIVPRSWVTVVVVASNLLLFADLSYFRSRAGYAPAVSTAQALKMDGSAEWLRQDSDRFRIFSLFTERDLPLRQQNILSGSAPSLWGLESVGYHGSLELRRYQRVLDGMKSGLLSGGVEARQLTGFLGFLQGKYVIAPNGVTLEGWNQVKEGAVTVWRNPEFRGGEFLVGRVVPEQTRRDERVFEEIQASSIDFRQTAVLASEEMPQLDGLGQRAEVQRLPAPYDAMNFAVNSDHPALLVIPNNFYPGWTAKVNGSPARIYRANWVGMGVLVNPGQSKVEMRFSTPGFHSGVTLSILSVLCWAASLLFVRTRVRRTAPPINQK